MGAPSPSPPVENRYCVRAWRDDRWPTHRVVVAASMRVDKIPPHSTMRVPYTTHGSSIGIWALATQLTSVLVVDDEHLDDLHFGESVPNRFKSDNLLQHSSPVFRSSRLPWSLLITNKSDVEVTVQHDVKQYVVEQ